MKKTACGNSRPDHTWVHLCTTAVFTAFNQPTRPAVKYRCWHCKATKVKSVRGA